MPPNFFFSTWTGFQVYLVTIPLEFLTYCTYRYFMICLLKYVLQYLSHVSFLRSFFNLHLCFLLLHSSSLTTRGSVCREEYLCLIKFLQISILFKPLQLWTILFPVSSTLWQRAKKWKWIVISKGVGSSPQRDNEKLLDCTFVCKNQFGNKLLPGA